MTDEVKESPAEPQTKEKVGARQSMAELHIGSTLRGISGYTQELGFATEEDFLSFIEGKRVCDVGSGYGLLAIEARLRGIKTDIVSISPDSEDPSFAEKQKRMCYESLGKSYSSAAIDEAISYCNQKTHAELAEELSLPDKDFDVVLDCWAVTYYANRIGLTRYKKSVQEMTRILKPGGKLRIAARPYFGWERKTSPQEQVFKDLNLQYEIVRSTSKTIVGAEATK